MGMLDNRFLAVSGPESLDFVLDLGIRSGGTSRVNYTLDCSCFSVSLITMISFSSRRSRFNSLSEVEPVASYGIQGPYS